MKKKIESLLFGGLVFALIYLIGSFGSADFNISNWEPVMRGFTAFFGGVISLTAAGIYYVNNTEL